ncbi:MAG TPA: hypothetical protein PLG90_09675 [Ignavibacteria bacterium]|nr:hypothetical protein [Ignavibacteria bacterium]
MKKLIFALLLGVFTSIGISSALNTVDATQYIYIYRDEAGTLYKFTYKVEDMELVDVEVVE